jgi:hypothetical protein
MKIRLVAGLLATLAASSAAACGKVTDEQPAPSPAPTTTSTPDVPPTPTKPPPPAQCGTLQADPQCKTLGPAPSTSASIAKFVTDGAVQLRCGEGNEVYWDLRPLVSLYAENKMFMIGEVHGSNEIGIVSSLIFEQLGDKKLVNVLGFELPMDLEDSIQRYVSTGKDPQAEQMMKQFAPNFFGTILTKTARQLAAKGIAIKVAAVDVPMQPETASDAIQAVAAKLTTQKDTVLATLPTSMSYPPTAAEKQQVNQYFDLIASKKAEICTELSADDCDRLDAMTHALWAGAMAYDSDRDDELWFARREQVIYYNMHAKMAASTDRMFLHMGAAHTNKFTFSAGSRMSKEYPLTKGQVFSVAPAYADGSVIWYGQDVDLPAQPETIVSALSAAPKHPFFVSTTRPNQQCQTNPVGEEMEETVGAGGRRADVYDGYILYGKLTSEKKPSQTELSRETPVIGGKPQDHAPQGQDGVTGGAIATFRSHLERRERGALTARASRHVLDTTIPHSRISH